MAFFIQRVVVEIACFHPDAAKMCAQWNVPRMELCANAMEGGTTPTVKDIVAVRNLYKGILGVMIRPYGGSFVLSDEDWREMHKEMNDRLNLGIDFFVFGGLTPDQRLAIEPCRSLVQRAHGVPCVLHRAFDEIEEMNQGLEDAIAAGFQRILTGRGARSLEELSALYKTAKQRIEILPGGGIRAHNAPSYLSAGATQLHSAALSALSYTHDVPLPDEEEVRKLLALFSA